MSSFFIVIQAVDFCSQKLFEKYKHFFLGTTKKKYFSLMQPKKKYTFFFGATKNQVIKTKSGFLFSDAHRQTKTGFGNTKKQTQTST